MLQKVIFKNFRCLRDVTVPLRPLTVLIGPNDSGKSAFLTGLRYLSGELSVGKFDFWRFQSKTKISLTVSGTSGNLQIERKGNEIVRLEPPGDNPLLPTVLYQLPSQGVPMTSGGYSDEGEPPEIGTEGTSIPALLDYLLRRDRERFFAVVKVMRDLVDGLEEIEIGTPQPDRRRVDLVIEKGLRIPADQTSVGVRLLLFFVALAYHPRPPKLILLEEPENGVHPKRLSDVMRLLREITQGAHADHAAQVVLATHSPHLLDYVDIDRDQVLVFRRDDDGSRTAEPADAERLKNFLDEFMLGEVWYNEGEAGLVGRDK